MRVTRRRHSVDALDAEVGFPLHSCEFQNRFIRGVLPLTYGVMKCFAEVCKVSVLRRTSILLLVAPVALLLPVVAVRAGSVGRTKRHRNTLRPRQHPVLLRRQRARLRLQKARRAKRHRQPRPTQAPRKRPAPRAGRMRTPYLQRARIRSTTTCRRTVKHRA